MTSLPLFKCAGDDQVVFPDGIFKEELLTIESIHTSSEAMAKMALALSNYENKDFIMLPFSTAIESQALGAHFTIGSDTTGPVVSGQPLCKTNEDIKNLPRMNFKEGILKEVLEAIQILKAETSKPIILKIEGPFTICEFLMDTSLFYKGILTRNESLTAFLDNLKDDLLTYTKKAIKKGASIISYGDPSGNLNIVGKKFFKQMNELFNKPFFEALETIDEKGLIHICGQVTNGLRATSLIDLESYPIEQGLSYSQALSQVVKKEDHVILIGNYCLNIAHKPYKKEYLYKINLL